MKIRASPFALFRATVGRRRQFVTEAEMVEYEHGYNNYPKEPKEPFISPTYLGYLDAKDDHEARRRKTA